MALHKVLYISFSKKGPFVKKSLATWNVVSKSSVTRHPGDFLQTPLLDCIAACAAGCSVVHYQPPCSTSGWQHTASGRVRYTLHAKWHFDLLLWCVWCTTDDTQSLLF
jgi:hypothetical protein